MTRPAPTLAHLEQINDTLAQAIDAAQGESELFLAKVAFYMGSRIENQSLFEEAISIALKDLEG